MGEFGPALREAALPVTAGALALALLARQLAPSRRRSALAGAAILIFLAPQVAALAGWNQSAALVVHQRLFLAFWLGAPGALLWRYLVRSGLGADWFDADSARRRLAALAAASALTVAAAALAREAALDAFADRLSVEGRVGRLWVSMSPGDLAPTYHAEVGGRRVRLTADLFGQLRPGDSVRVEVGAGSGTALALRARAVAAEATPR